MSVRVAAKTNHPKDQVDARLLHVLKVGLESMSGNRPTTSPSIGNANVEVRDSPVGGKGLFASGDMAAGTEVARMIDPARMRRGAWDVYHAALARLCPPPPLVLLPFLYIALSDCMRV